MENNRNYFVAIALSVVILVAWQFLYVNPKIERERIIAEQQAARTAANPAASTTTTPGQPAVAGAVPGGADNREESIARSARVTIDTPALAGSINLTGARFDDLKLKEYRETVDPKSPNITLFSPSDTQDGYFTEIGYIADATSGAVPGPQTVWTQAGSGTLTASTPVTLTFTNEKGIVFTRTISVDDHLDRKSVV